MLIKIYFTLVFLNLIYKIEGGSWGYENLDGWSNICKTGLEQSPINIIEGKSFCDKELNLELQFSDIDYNLTMDPNRNLQSNGKFCTFKSKTPNGEIVEFESSQFHIHDPSEHKFNGQFFDAEIHIVHKLKKEYEYLKLKRTFAVIGLVFNIVEDYDQPTFFHSWNPQYSDGKLQFTFNMKNAMIGIFDGQQEFFSYEGSLTTPPCSEIVDWYWFMQPLPITKSQFEMINRHYRGNLSFAGGHGNNREIMPLNDRLISKGNCIAQNYYGSPMFYVWVGIIVCGFIGIGIVLHLAKQEGGENRKSIVINNEQEPGTQLQDMHFDSDQKNQINEKLLSDQPNQTYEYQQQDNDEKLNQQN